MATPELSQDDRQRLEEAFEGFDERAETVDAAEAMTVAGTKEVFCRNWPTVKEVLAFLAGLPLLPASVRKAIGLVIKAGDTAHGAIC